MKATWLHIPRRSRCCARGEELLLKEESYFSVLEREGKGNFFRRDFCPSCWEKVDIKTACPHKVAHWRVHKRRALPPSSEGDATTERALSLFCSSMESSPEKALVVALLLERRRHFVLRHEGSRSLLFEERGSGELYEVEKVELPPGKREEWVHAIAEELAAV